MAKANCHRRSVPCPAPTFIARSLADAVPADQAASNASRRKEGAKQRRAFLGALPPRDVRSVMAGPLRKELRTMQHGTAFWIFGTKHQPVHTRKTHGPGAHRAGLKRNDKRRSDKP